MTILEVIKTLPSKVESETQVIYIKELPSETSALVNSPYRITILSDFIVVPFAVDMDNYTNYTIAIESFGKYGDFYSFRVMTRDGDSDFDSIEEGLIRALNAMNTPTQQLLYDNTSRLDG